MRSFLVLCALWLTLSGCSDPDWPYDESANANAELLRAQDRATASNKLLLLLFGANWCEDCRVLDHAMQAPEIEAIVNSRFEVVKIDIGQWDKHLDLNEAWDDPIAGGIPALIVATPGGRTLYTTKAGELATARQLDLDDFYLFFAHLAELNLLPD